LYHTVLPRTQRRDELATDHGHPRKGNLGYGGKKELGLAKEEELERLTWRRGRWSGGFGQRPADFGRVPHGAMRKRKKKILRK
jgi:hypothetical protein